jgi:site-specific recombinase XerD
MLELIPYADPFALLDRLLAQDPRLTSLNSRQAYRLALTQFDTWRSGRPFSKLLVEEFISQLQSQDLAPSTINQKLSAIRWYASRTADYVNELNPRKKDDQQEFERVRDDLLRHLSRIASIHDVKGERVRPGREIRDGEFAALMKVCADDPTAAGIRDGAIIALVTLTGLRREEIVSLDMEDFQIEEENGEGVLIVRGRGNKQRRAYVYNGAALALADWMVVRGQEPGPLFVPINKGGSLQPGHRLSVQALHKILLKRAEQAEVEKLTWHDFRRTFAGNLLDAGIDLATVQVLMGHSSPVTTSIYDRRGERVRRKAVQKLFVPYTRRKLENIS